MIIVTNHPFLGMAKVRVEGESHRRTMLKPMTKSRLEKENAKAIEEYEAGREAGLVAQFLVNKGYELPLHPRPVGTIDWKETLLANRWQDEYGINEESANKLLTKIEGMK